MLGLPLSAFLPTCISVLSWHIPLCTCNICMSRYLSITPIDQLRRQLGVRFYSIWYYTRAGVGILARKSGLVLNLNALSRYQ